MDIQDDSLSDNNIKVINITNPIEEPEGIHRIEVKKTIKDWKISLLIIVFLIVALILSLLCFFVLAGITTSVVYCFI